MSKHKSEDYKINAVNYYLDNDVSMDYVCNIYLYFLDISIDISIFFDHNSPLTFFHAPSHPK